MVSGGSLPLGGMHYSDLQAARLNNDEDIPAGAIGVGIGETDLNGHSLGPD